MQRLHQLCTSEQCWVSIFHASNSDRLRGVPEFLARPLQETFVLKPFLYAGVYCPAGKNKLSSRISLYIPAFILLSAFKSLVGPAAETCPHDMTVWHPA